MRAIACTLACLALAACTTPQPETPRSGGYLPTHAVEILLDPPLRAHTAFAVVEDTHGGTPAQINARLALRGREIGADAVLITAFRHAPGAQWTPLADPAPGYHGRRYVGPRYPAARVYRGVQALALKYTEPR